jgi:ribosomal-protein-alanine N-acetyltransferase
MSMAILARTAEPDGKRGRLRLHVWSAADAEEMGAYWARNREHLLPTQPYRDASFWTVEGQRQRVERASNEVAIGRMLPFLVREDGELVAEIGLSDVVRGAFCSANLGYSVDGERLRMGIASWAVAAVVDIAFDDVGLHRLQAGTMVDNVASQGVLQRCGFARIGVARAYLAISGGWRDHVLWQRTNDELPPPGP